MHDVHILTLLHILCGTLGILSGFAAIFLRKGSRRHRQAGMVFVISMLLMSGIAAFLAWMGTEVAPPNRGNLLAGLLTFYMVGTAWLSGRRGEHRPGPLDLAALALVTAVASGYALSARAALVSPDGLKDGYSAGLYIFFGCFALLAAVLDIRMLVRGGVSGFHRVARHLWRMCFALWIAATSLFLGQPQVFPEWMHKIHVLFLPSLLIVVLALYHLVRVLFGGFYKRSPAAPNRVPAGP